MTKPNGFTLIELCVVVSLLAIFLLLVGSAIPHSFDRQQTRVFLDQFSADLYWAQSQARSRKAMVYVDIYPNLNLYLIKVDRKQEKLVRLPQGFTLDSNFPNDLITFYGDGQITKAGTVEILDRRRAVYRVIFQLSSGRFYIKQGDPI